MRKQVKFHKNSTKGLQVKIIKLVLFSLSTMFLSGCVGQILHDTVLWPLDKYARADDFHCGCGDTFTILNQCDFSITLEGISPHGHRLEEVLAPRGMFGSADVLTLNPEEFNGASAIFLVRANHVGSASYAWASSQSAYSLGYPTCYRSTGVWNITESTLH